MTRRIARRGPSRTALAALLCLLAAAAAQASVPTLYHSPHDNGADPGAVVPPLAPNGTRTLYLYLKPGGVITTNGGQLCNGGAGGPGGNGDETCGLNFEVAVDGDLTITGFTPSVGQPASKLDPKLLRVAIVTTSPPLSAGPTRIGTLTVLSGPTGGNVSLSKLQTVDASLDLMTGAPRTLAYVPEPSFGLQIVSGVFALALLSRRRSKQGGVR